MHGKAFYYSKTFWVNIVGVAAMMGQSALGFDIGAEYQVSALALINLVLRGVTKGPVDWGKLGNIIPVVFLLLIMPLTFSMQGCAVTTALIDDHTLVAELAVRAATGRVLEEHPDWTEQTYHITGDAIRLLSSDDTTSLDGLQQYVVDQIPWDKLTPEEQALLTTLISAAVLQIEQSLADRGVIEPGEATIRAAMVLTWINQTAEIRLPKLTEREAAAEEAYQRASATLDRIQKERMRLLFAGDKSGADTLVSQALQAEQQVDNRLSIAMGVWLSPASL